MDLSSFLKSSLVDLNQDIAEQLSQSWTTHHFGKSELIVGQDQTAPMEYILLNGSATSQISDPDGRRVCVAFHTSPCVITPNVARTRSGQSLVSIETNDDCLVAQIGAEALTDMMVRSEQIRQWANDILQLELTKKTEREWCLAALGGENRLAWFRENYPNHEALFPHTLVASFLGMTPVTLSRLRVRKK